MSPVTSSGSLVVRRAVVVHGIVQGVGFRPFVYGLASRLGLTGFVRNKTDGVRIEIEGIDDAVDQFIEALRTQAPSLARIDQVESEAREARGDAAFRIESSEASTGAIQMSPDVPTCDACVRELFDPGDRRYGYAFINCTSCGPRLTIIEAAPYDRGSTTMARFAMCTACQAEYDDPRDRRFHAQPNACPACGPRLALHGSLTSDPIGDAARAVRAGRIVAIKGLGGYHLACDATSAPAVATLRDRKHRDEKPFAIMVTDLDAAASLCELSAADRAALSSRERPITLVARRPDAALAANVAPANPLVGVMLPYTPLHHLLMRASGGLPLVMTSGNQCDEPIAYEDGDAIARLQGIADLILLHDRPIRTRCDDSVVRVIGARATSLRRSRGYAPQMLRLPRPCDRPILALGGHLKATFAFGRDDRALLGHHIGDLDDHRAYGSYVEAIAHYERVFQLTPAALVHDLHPDYGSTRYAQTRGVPRIAVQHHHAHVASCMAEHGLAGPVIGVAFDGSGYGLDGALWGGELLLGDLRAFERVAHLRYVPLPGGERAIREPWRMALSHLLDAGAGALAASLLDVPATERALVERMIEQRINAPLTSSVGRLFDAIAAIAGLGLRTTFEGQAAMQLEWLAATAPAERAYEFTIVEGIIDSGPVVRAAAADRLAGVAAARIARRFHEAIIDLVVAMCRRIREASAVAEVALSGGVFQNAIVTAGVCDRLGACGFRVYQHREVPPNDGGLALGQLAIAAARGVD